MISKRIEDQTEQILNDLQITELPVPINKIAEYNNLEIHPFDFGENISGVLVIDPSKDKGVIGLNPLESKVRQRFTIAHELAHFILHRSSRESLFVDKDFRVLFRKQESSIGNGEFKREQEANAFAASILMPKHLVEEKIKELSIDLTDENAIKTLANMFEVSIMSMTYRIANLKLI
jgi:Zn-dependent peptidase ImmA (M78 family)